MKAALGIIGAIILVVIIYFGFILVDVDQTEDGSLPDVNVDVESGSLPEYDAEVGEINVGEEEVEVEVPDVEITTETETMTVPTLDVVTPDEGEAPVEEEGETTNN